MATGTNDRWFFEDPVARKIRLDLRDGRHERRREAWASLVVGAGAAASTFLAGVKILDLGAVLWRLTDLAFLAPVMSALTVM